MPAREKLFAAAERLHAYLLGRIGFQQHEAGKAINYFYKPRGKVPSNSVEAAWVFARLWQATGDERYLEHLAGLMDFVRSVQLATCTPPHLVS
jgi:hypothetical protein